MIPRVNDIVLLPHLPDWSQAPKSERRWQSALSSAVSGMEARASLRQAPIRSLEWRVVPFDAQERGLLDDRLRAAVIEGTAAVPWWGRGLRLASAASGTTVTLDDLVPDAWVPSAGAHIIFFGSWSTPGGAVWEVAEIESVAGHALTLTAALAQSWDVDGCWELWAGSVRMIGAEALTDHTGPYALRVDGYRGVLSPYAFTPPNAVACAPDGYSLPGLDGLAPALAQVRVLDPNILSLVYQVEVESEASPTDQAAAVWEYANYVPDPEDAVWIPASAVVTQESAAPTYWHCRMQYRQAYLLRVTVSTFGTALTSPTIVIPALTPEAMMRVVNERYESIGGTPFTWPYSAPNYPSDGFFDTAIGLYGNTAHAAILNALRTALRTSGFLRNYQVTAGTLFAGYKATPLTRAVVSDWGLNPSVGAALPYYDRVLSETLLGTTITTANWSAWWDDIGRVVLQLFKVLKRPDSAGAYQIAGSVSQSSGDMKPNILGGTNLAQAAQAGFDAASPVATADPMGVRTTITATSVTNYPWGQTYNSPGSVLMTFTYGSWFESIVEATGEKSLYRAAYYGGYDLGKFAVVGQDGVTPYHDNAGLTDVFYNGYGHPLNLPAGLSGNPNFAASTQFVSVGRIPYDAGVLGIIREAEIGSGLDTDAVAFLWLDVFNTSSRPLRDLGVEMVCVVSWYRSPWPEDEHWEQYLHQPAPE